MPAPMPSYKNPPVVETVLGVEFRPLTKWSIPHFGLFWQKVRDSFPRFESQAPLVSQIEQFELPKQQVPSIELVDQLESRVWYISEDDRRLIQLQRNRFLHNWRKGDSDVEYPRYEKTILPSFQQHWSRYLEFLDAEGLDSPNVIQCEVTYVNHIPKGDGWTTIADWHQVFRMLGASAAQEFLPAPESGKFNLNYVIADKKGRLRVTANSAVRNSDGRQIIHLQLTARGNPSSSSTNDIVAWLNLGREWIVRGFTNITTESMHKIWEREQ